MKAIGVSAPGATEVVALDLPDPPPPGEGQLLIEVEAAGVGPWDQLLNTGGWDVGLRPPAALGVEGVGRVRAIGPGVQGISVGDRLVTHEAPLPGGSGFWAEEVLVTAAHTASVPTEMDPVVAAALPVNGLTAMQALEALGLTTGQRLLITNGGGSTGALAIQLAAAAGVEVTATASPSATERLREFGASEVIDYHDRAWSDRVQADFDAALIAAPGTAAIALPLVRDGGQLCSLTSDAPNPERGITSTNLYVRPDAAQLTQLTTALARGLLRLTVEPLPLTDGPIAFDRVAADRTAGRKLVLVP
ncbi:NADP-dependent oxidoreductase [Streptomyces spinosirectus]|uniref:NADP-dependent oxidoreductase n=1 Tax=Streptomyces TaxID=1883 RepID=UPI001C9DC027|nr:MULTISPECIES: NADP-dependent oxidoreductase [Streptomyces]MBY8343475.1 NADP-dependent oxidoreductase [Streptomyces plumbidurans]UIR22528.1 NADP-dependent oxidoreductase [Streptomyces spinosirectus]